MINWPSKAIFFALICLFHPVQPVNALETDGRFTMTPTEDGFLRLDSKTGAIALCGRLENGWTCKPVDDAQLASQDKLASLTKENSDLKAEIEDLRRALDAQITGTPSGGANRGFKMPTEQDVDKLMSVLERLARRFKSMVDDLKEQQQPGTPL